MKLYHVALFALVLVCLAGFAAAEPVPVKVGTYLLNVGNYDPAFGSYDLSFYLWFRWDPSIEGFTAANFEFMNGKGVSTELIEERPGYLLYRGEGSFFKKLDMSDFPFDSHELSLEIEDKLLTANKLVYVQDTEEQSSMNPDIAVLGWKTRNYTVSIESHYYSTWNQNYSRYVHHVSVSRPRVDFIKVFLPIFFLSILGFLTFFINIRKFSERISLSVFTFMAAIAYQIQVNVTIPPLGFFTFADKAMIAVYAGLLFSTIYTIYIEWFEERRKERAAFRVNRFAVYFYFILQLLVLLLTMLLDYLSDLHLI